MTETAKPGGALAKAMALELKATQASQKQLETKAEESGKTEQQVEKVTLLPLWPESVYAVPNGFLRSALFGAIQRGKRKLLEGFRVHAQDGIEISYSGARLDQGDLDVWVAVLDAVKEQALGSVCRTNAYQLLRAMSKSDTGGNRKVLDKRLSRLKATGLKVAIKRPKDKAAISYEGSLIASIERDEGTREYVIRLDSRLHSLFARDQFTQLQKSVRQTLDGHPLSQWLHGFYSSHAKPFPMRCETLLELSGSENTHLFSARQKLKKALDTLANASNAHGQRFSYAVISGVVHVERAPSATQKRHIIKRAASKGKVPSKVPS